MDDFWPQVHRVNNWSLGGAAVAYGAGGLKVFPIWGVRQLQTGAWVCRCPTAELCSEPGKHPLVGWKEGASSDKAVIQAWWSRWPDANIGVALGPSDLVVVDLDQHESTSPDGEISVVDGSDSFQHWLSESGVVLEDGIRALTGGGGEHLFFEAPNEDAERIKNCIGWLPGVDIKAAGGYVLVSPSVHVSGRVYAWREVPGAAPAVLPSTLEDALRAAVQTGSGRPGRSAGVSGRVAANSVESDYDYNRSKTDGPPEGYRDQFFNSYAFELRRSGVSRETALARMRGCWEKIAGKETFPWSVAEGKLSRVWVGGNDDVGVDEDKQVGKAEVLGGWAAGVSGSGSGVGSGGGGEAAIAPVIHIAPRIEAKLAGSIQDELTDQGAALRYVQLNKDLHKYTPSGDWFAWNGVYWVRDSDGAQAKSVGMARLTEFYAHWLEHELPGWGDEEQRKIRRAFMTGLRHGNTISRVFNLAKIQADIRVESMDAWNPDPWLLVVKNGTVDLKTGKLRESCPEDMCNLQADVWFDEGARSEKWEGHVAMLCEVGATGVVDGSAVDYLQRWAGYSLSGSCDEQQFLLLHGKGNNGKSAMAEALLQVLGKYEHGYGKVGNTKLVSGQGAREHDTIWMDLAGKRMVHIDEVPRAGMNEERVKKITGESDITARKIAGNPVTFRAQFKTWLTANNLPHIADATDGFWRRCVRLPCEGVVREEVRVAGFVRMLGEEEEKSGILNWCLEGVRRYLEMRGEGGKSGLGEVPLRALWAGQEYRSSEDQLGGWLEEMFVDPDAWKMGEVDIGPDEDGRMAERTQVGMWYPNVVLIQMFMQWCSERGEKPEYSNRTLPAGLVGRGWARNGTPRRISRALVTSGVARGIVGPLLVDGVPAQFMWSESS